MNVNSYSAPSLKFKWLFVALLALTVATLQACTEDELIDAPTSYGSVGGQVFYTATRLPVPNALVQITSSGRSVVTDSSGRFRIDSLLTGSYTLRTTQVGYAPEATTIQIVDDRVQLVNIYLDDDRSLARAPNPPTVVSPTSGAINQSTNIVLRWKGTDPNRTDTLRYDVRIFREGETAPTTLISNTRADTLLVRNLQFNTTYYWQVIAKDPTDLVTNGEVWSFRTSPVPDFNYVFARRVSGRFQIFASNDAGQTAQLTLNGNNWRPIASPNREKIAFISNLDADPQLYLMDRDGSNMRRVTTVPVTGLQQTDLSFCWSPDGTQLLYPSNDKLYAVRTDGTGLRVVYQAPLGRLLAGCDWTDQGNRMVIRTTGPNLYDNEIALINADGTNFKSLFARKTNRMSNPVFSVDGQRILFAYDVTATGFQTPEGRQLNSRMQLLDIATGTLTDASFNKDDGTNDLEPRFSANGALIIFTNSDNRNHNTQTVVPPVVFTATLPGSSSSNNSNQQRRERRIEQGEMPAWR
jgi:hypothetical protein